jgi:glycosyltransferase involved in cell wall biosynthesis
MVIHTPWSRNLGAPRVQLELGEELSAQGCEVTKFSWEDAFPSDPPLPSSRWLAAFARGMRANRDFSRRAVAWIRQHPGAFDVIDAHQTDIPVAKRELGFAGLLVARSVGLIPEYEKFERFAQTKWGLESGWRRRLHRWMAWPHLRRRRRNLMPSLRHADLINVSNSDDLATVRDGMGMGDKVIHLPFGLSAARRAAFRRAQKPAVERLARATVAFIGTWNARKGAKDWPAIVERVVSARPEARFRFLGTGIPEAMVRREFPTHHQHAIHVVPVYESEDLPGLLADATVGAFPGYLEGFGFSVLEKVAAGLPTVTYDAPGPRDVMRHLSPQCMVTPGDTEAFARRVLDGLGLPPDAYGRAAAESNRVADLFSWHQIARETAARYRQCLERLRR